MSIQPGSSVRGSGGNRRPASIPEALERIYAQKGLKPTMGRESLQDLPLEEDPLETELLIDRLTCEDRQLNGCLKVWITVANADASSPSLHRLAQLAQMALVRHPAFDEDDASASDGDDVSEFDRADVTRNQLVKLVSTSEAVHGLTPAQRELLIDNAFMCIRLSEVLSGHLTREGFIESMGAALWSDQIRMNVAPAASQLARQGRSKGMRLLWQHHVSSGARQRALEREAEARAKAAESQVARSQQQLAEFSAALEEASMGRDQLLQQVQELQATLTTEREGRVVDQHHHVDDVEGLRTGVLRNLTSQVDLMSDGLHALRNGKPEIADEFLDRALVAIQKQVLQLRRGGREE